MRIFKLTLILILLSCSLFAEDKIIIEEIKFENAITGELVENELLQPATGLVIGKEYDLNEFVEKKLSEVISKLSDDFKSEFSEINASLIPNKDNESRIQITFELLEIYSIEEIIIDLPENSLLDVEVKEKLLSKTDSTFSLENLQVDLAILENHYKSLGYSDVQIDPKLNTYEDKISIQIVVTHSNEPKILKKISFEGNNTFKNKKLKNFLQSKTGSALTGGKPFNVLNVEKDIRGLVNFYKTNGFMDVKISSSINELKKNKIELAFKIEENHQYTIKSREIKTKKNEDVVIIEEISKKYVKNNYNEQNIRLALQKIREHFGNRGYVLVQADFTYDTKNEVLTITVDKGNKYLIDEIIIEGNYKTPQDIVLEDVLFVPGEEITTELIQNTVKRLRRRGFFSNVKIDFRPKDKTSGDVIIKVYESGIHVFQFTAGVGAQSENFAGSISYSNPNLFWNGQAISVQAFKSEERERLAIIFSDPHFLGTDLEFYAGISYTNTEYEHFDKKTFGLSATIKKVIKEKLKLGIGIRVDFVDIENISSALAAELPNANGKDTIMGFVGSLIYNNEEIDEFGNPVGGYKVKATMLPSFSDENGAYLKGRAEFIINRSLAKMGLGSEENPHLISVRFTVGAATSQTPFYEKFYGGGVSTIRGFESKSITGDSEAVGGQYMLGAKFSYSFPMLVNGLRGILFIETLSVGDDIDELEKVRASIGFGLNANLTKTFLGTTVEAGFAVPVISYDGDSVNNFYFILGAYDPSYDI